MQNKDIHNLLEKRNPSPTSKLAREKSLSIQTEFIKEKPSLLSTAEQMIPAARIIYVFQLIKSKFDVDTRLSSEIDWCIDQIASGKIYEPAECFMSPTAAPVAKSPALPWLAQFSTPRINLEEIQDYLNATANMTLSPTPEQLAKKDEERVKRRSVLANDLADSIQKREKFMETIDSEEFSIMEAKETLGRDKVLPIIAFHIFQKHNIFSTTSIDENAFVAFVSEIRKGYVHSNPYHNDVHAADVLQMCHLMLTKGEIQKTARLSQLDVAALLLAAIIHDYKHPGVTNGFLQNSQNELAILYNDKSILENYHVSEAYKIILRVKDCNLFKDLTATEKSIMRKRIVSTVLGTDMVAHGEMISKLHQMIVVHGINKGRNAEKIIRPKTEFEDKQFILNVCLHLADIGNPCRSFAVYRALILNLLEEFGRQGDVEKSMNLPISFLCDRTTINLPVSQIGYITGVLKPLLMKMVTLFPGLKLLLDNANKSEQEWRKIGS